MNGIDWDLVRRSLLPLLEGLVRGTIPLTVITFVLGLALAVLLALMRLSGNPVVSGIARAYVSIIRGTPLLLQLFIIFFALPSLGVTLDPWPSAIIGLSLNVGAYASEAVRGAILAVPRGQWEAAMTVGMDRRTTLRRVVLPQASRIAVPPLSNTLISLVKDTSLVSAITVTELLRTAQQIAAPTFDFFTLYGLAAVYYWVVCLVLSFGQTRLETRLSRYVAA
ncbi:amino acid ABC transporter permease [Klenkia brasiliensis]|uniref:Amino acid ABC transporter membrane protein, PAAT family (TC 3.A.1.3.-) n=1 Tax=Klenkia brasiliensis TaxID=333142 RepID=A0A1G7SYX7_9ACTN|nr:amino acid ABC transporter permease [Klenkia brasiliensis]SDG28072.1 amino acid ABC transporter membrane protein, PAAT family (TC 3.A.1.3.-) [Klenkia brasiliensis]